MPNTFDLAAKAPITTAQRAVLERDASDVRAAAARKGFTCDAWEERAETSAAREHFELGCWLFYYSRRVGMCAGLADRVNCARRLFESGVFSPRYDFFTVFEFGERQFDTIFEMGDSAEVLALLRIEARKNPAGNLAKAFAHHGWSMAEDVTPPFELTGA